MVRSFQDPKFPHTTMPERQIVGILKRNPELVQYVLETLTPLLQNSDDKIREAAGSTLYLLLEENSRPAKEVVNVMISFLKHSEECVRKSATHNIRHFMKFVRSPEPQFITDLIIKHLIPRLQDPNKDTRWNTIKSVVELATTRENNDVHFLQDVTKAFLPLLKDSDQMIRREVPSGLERIIEMSENRDSELIQDLIKALTPILQDPDSTVRTKVSESIAELKKLDIAQAEKEAIALLASLSPTSDKDLKFQVFEQILETIPPKENSQFWKYALNVLTPLLQDPDSEVREKMLYNLVYIVDMDKTLVRDAFGPLCQASRDEDNDVAIAALENLERLVKIDKIRDPQLPRDVLNILSPFLQAPRNSDRTELALKNLKKLAKYNSGDIQLAKEVINLMTPVLQDAESEIREMAVKEIVEVSELVLSGDNCDIEFIQSMIQIFSPLFKDPYRYLRKAVFSHIIDLLEFTDKKDTQLIQNTLDLAASFAQESDQEIRRITPQSIIQLVQKIGASLYRKALEALVPLLNDSDDKMRLYTRISISYIVRLNPAINDVTFLRDVIASMTPFLKDSDEYARAWASESISKTVNFSDDIQLPKEALKLLSPFLKDSSHLVRSSAVASMARLCRNPEVQFARDLIENYLVPVLKDSDLELKQNIAFTLREIFDHKKELLNYEMLGKTLIPLLKDTERDIRKKAQEHLTDLLKISDDVKLAKQVIEILVPLLEDSDKEISQFTPSNIVEILQGNENVQLVADAINILTPFFQHSNLDVAKNALEVLRNISHKLFPHPDIFAQYLTHSSRNLRDTVTSCSLAYFEKYLNDFRALEQLFQRPLSDLTVELIIKKLFNDEKNECLQENLQNHLNKLQEEPEKLKLFLVSEINKIGALQGPGIIALAMVAIGYEKAPKDGSDREKLVDSAKEVLNIQMKYLNEDGLIWINKNCEKVLSLSPEAKVFYKKVCHKLLEDEEVTSLEEQLLIKFINQGLTASLTRDGQIIFEGKRYKLKGDNIELALEKIAKTVIDQQQDILAMQYKQHEPIFKSSGLQGGMKQAAADIKEIRSIVDSRHALKIGSWLLTKLKSLKFNSEIFLLEQRSAFGDHVVYHLNHQKLIRFYPNEVPVLQEVFGSYIYGEAYQGEITELSDSAGEKLLTNSNIKPSAEGKLKSKQIYFQQELLKQGNEDRNSAVEEELAKKLDNNRAVLESKLKSLKLQDAEKNLIQDYYEGFISTFSSVYTSSQAIDSGKLSIDDGEDFFSPVNLFIQLTSLAPFGIGKILSGGLEAVRSHLKSTTITNEAKLIKDFAIDAVELSDLVSKIALNIISNKEQRKKILEAKDDEEPNSLVNKVKNLVMEKIEKLKNMAEKYTKMKNLFEKEVETSPAFRLGETDANRIIKEWIDLKGSQPDLRMKPDEKHKKFVKFIIGESAEVIEVNRITPMPSSPQEVKPSARGPGKGACCEIF